MSGLTENSLTFKPFQYPWAMACAEEHEKIHWGTWEVKLLNDVAQWKKGQVSDSEKAYITQILRVFTQSDCAVAANYCDVFIPHFKNNEIRNMLLSFACREGTHQRAYALLNDTLGFADTDYSLFLNFAEMRHKIEFMTEPPLRLPTKDMHIAYELARSVCNEGMSLFSAFAMLLNFQRFGKMRGMCEVVEWSIRDEDRHVEGMTRLFQTYCKETPNLDMPALKGFIELNYKAAVLLEDALIDLVYNTGSQEGLAADDVKAYVRYLANARLTQLGLDPIYPMQKNPLPWLDWVISGDSLKNFFEGTVTDYSASGLVGELDWSLITQGSDLGTEEL